MTLLGFCDEWVIYEYFMEVRAFHEKQKEKKLKQFLGLYAK